MKAKVQAAARAAARTELENLALQHRDEGFARESGRRYLENEAAALEDLLPDDDIAGLVLEVLRVAWPEADVSRCSACGEPAHASETDDLDRCDRCR